MINAKVLRVGNYVKRIDTGGVIIIEGISHTEINPFEEYAINENGERINRTGLKYEMIEPVILTKAILSRCGFKDGRLEHGDLVFFWDGVCVAYGVINYSESTENDPIFIIDNNSIKY